ncbi:uncharacterized protein LOC127956010 isoform X3 [Carassius gibelio]|uniref:uncharacterized protein LOC127956010 isoform X3 n=1 Tax=Carassius gibelio TaxID=101364 RepID=UPI002278E69D|nr:uncharacterized protein LOC127956010 isoform X3 [Carassius gibelio]
MQHCNTLSNINKRCFMGKAHPHVNNRKGETPGESTEIHVTHSLKMTFIKEESEDLKIEEAFRIKQDEQTDQMVLKVESRELNETEEKDQYEKHHHFMTGENSTQNEKISVQKTTSNSSFTCHQCVLFSGLMEKNTLGKNKTGFGWPTRGKVLGS